MSESPVVIITGASKGIGKATTLLALEKFNARVVVVARSQELLKQLEDIAQDMGKQAQLACVPGDITDDAILHKAVNTAVDKWGRLDSVIANAGIIEPFASVAESSIRAWKRLYDVNVFSVVSLVELALPYIRKSDKGSIILVSSGAASKGYKGWGAYGSSKAALNHLASTLAAEEPSITTIAVRPGVVDTDMQQMIRDEGKEAMQDNHDKFIDLHQNGQLVKPEDPGHVLIALANNPPKNLSGQFCSWDEQALESYRRS